MILVLCSCGSAKNATRINDISIFVNEEYVSFDSTDPNVEWWKKTPGRNAKRFFPSYEEIVYEYANIEFYIFAYLGVTFPDATFVLEMQFDDASKYEEAKADIYALYDFLEKPVRKTMPACEYTVGDFVIKILTQGEDRDSFPHSVFAICENDNENIMRYMYLYCEDIDAIATSDFVNGVKNRTNCEW